jgi:hypothetical protein
MTQIPYGHCHCGCGEKTGLAKLTNKRYGHVKGEPVRFVHNHHHIKNPGRYVLIPLFDGGSVSAYAKVDVADAILANRHWRLSREGYAVSRAPRFAAMSMHRMILGLKRGDGLEGDHINRDKLDNRRSNLRVVDRRLNAQNVSAVAGSTSRFRGVSAKRGLWRARWAVDGVTHYLGTYRTELEAAAAVEAFRAAHLPDVWPDQEYLQAISTNEEIAA